MKSPSDNKRNRLEQPSAEPLFRELAARYAETEGQLLRQELDAANSLSYYTPALDRKIHRLARGRNAGRILLGLASAAACLLAVLTVPSLLRNSGAANTNPGTSHAGGAPAIIPLSFSLPENLSVADTELDNGQSVYYLSDRYEDNVVMTLEKTDFEPGEGLTAIRINGSAAYTRATADYQLLTFCKDGVLYTLTCRYELGTLLNLGEQIL